MKKIIIVLSIFLIIVYICLYKINLGISISDMKYDNIQNIYYEYGQVSSKIKYIYNLNSNSKKVVEQFNNNSEIFMNEDTGDEFQLNYAVNGALAGNSIRRINRIKNIDEIVLSSDDIKQQYSGASGIRYIYYSKDKNKLIFSSSCSSHNLLLEYDLNNEKLRLLSKYKSISYLCFSRDEYIINNNKIFIIDIDSNICIYDISNGYLHKSICSSYNFTISDDGKTIYYVDFGNNLCSYDIQNKVNKIILKLESENIEWMDIDNDNNYILLVESLKSYSWTGSSIHMMFRQNELNIYEITTKKKYNIVKPSLFNVIFKACFVDD